MGWFPRPLVGVRVPLSLSLGFAAGETLWIRSDLPYWSWDILRSLIFSLSFRGNHPSGAFIAKAFDNVCSDGLWLLSPLWSPSREDLQPLCPVAWFSIQTRPGLDKHFDWRDTVGSKMCQRGWSRWLKCLVTCLRGGERYHGICRKYAFIHPSIFNICFLLQSALQGSAGASPCCIRVKVGSHLGQDVL